MDKINKWFFFLEKKTIFDQKNGSKKKIKKKRKRKISRIPYNNFLKTDPKSFS